MRQFFIGRKTEKRLFFLCALIAIAFLPVCGQAAGLKAVNGDSKQAGAEVALLNGDDSQETSNTCSYGEDLSKQCEYRMSHAAILQDGNVNTYCIYKKGETLVIAWGDDIPVRSVCLQFSVKSIVPYTVYQYGAAGELISETEGTQFYNNAFTVSKAAREIHIAIGESDMRICSLCVYGEGFIPNFHPWRDRPSKADYMLVATHPDDEVLFLGAVIPTYEGQQGRKGIEVISCSEDRLRFDEALNCAWTMGLRSEPIFAVFKDIPSSDDAALYRLETVTKYYVRLFRQYQPEVVITQDEKGEYGHWQHIRTVEAVKLAVRYAANPEYDTESVQQYGTWEVKKLYLHLYSENQISLDIDTPLTRMNGKSAYQIAQEAYDCHASQKKIGRHLVRREGVYDLTAFGLEYTTVGMDSEGVNDMFEHIDQNVLHSNCS